MTRGRVRTTLLRTRNSWRSMIPSRRNCVVLGVLLALATTYYGMYFHHVVSLVAHASERVRAPFECSGRLVSAVAMEASAAGIRNGDTIEEIEGKPFIGKRILDQRLEKARPKSLLAVGIHHPDGT